MDSAGNCTLRAAIQQANHNPNLDEIYFDLTLPATINIDENSIVGELVITENLKIKGIDARQLTIAGEFQNTQDGLFIISSNNAANIEINNLSIKNSSGAAIINAGNLKLNEVHVKESNLGISNSGNLTMIGSLVSENSVRGLDLSATSSTNIANTTIAQNTSNDVGGGIYARNGNLTLNNVSIVENSAVAEGGGIYYSNEESGVYLRNNLISGNNAAVGADVFSLHSGDGAKFTSRGNNLISQVDDDQGFTNGTNYDIVGSISEPIDSLLSPLQNNGGNTDTFALLDESPARDAGNGCVVNSFCDGLNPPPNFLFSDQRGENFPRSYEAGVDIGAFESFYLQPEISGFEPISRGAGTESFDLIVKGQKFVADSVVKWNDQPRSTIFISDVELKTQISASEIAVVGTFPVSVVNPAPNGGTTQSLDFSVIECSYSLDNLTGASPAAGSNIPVTLTAPSGCGWSAVSDDSWISISSASNGSGSAEIIIEVAPNTGIARNGTVTIADQIFTVQQENGCQFTLAPTSAEMSASGGNGNFSVNASGDGCIWTAESDSPWITITSENTGNTDGEVEFFAKANSGTARTGTIEVSGQTFTVNQEENCTFSLNPDSFTIDQNGGGGQFSVETGSNCGWTAASNNLWITISEGMSGSGGGIVDFEIEANIGPERVGTITVADQTFTITQANGCVYSISPTNQNIQSAGGSSQFSITTAQGCQWSAVSDVSWITITNQTTGSGEQTFGFDVVENVGPERSGTITVADQIFTVNQENGCSYILTPSAATIGNSESDGQFTISTAEGCQWTAVSNDSWIIITNEAAGSGDSTIEFTIDSNTGPERIGTITVADQTFTVTQISGCVYNISAASVNVNESGGTKTFDISTEINCPWTAVSNESWITVEEPTEGMGDGTITLTIAPSSDGQQRIGTIAVAELTFTVNQLTTLVSNYDDDGIGSLRYAIANANSIPEDDVIRFAQALEGTITLTSGEILIASNGSLLIDGSVADILTISAGNQRRHFYSDNAVVKISGLTLTRGNAVGNGSTEFNKHGGSIYAFAGSLTLDKVHINDNKATVSAGQGNTTLGGGVYFYGGTNHLIENSALTFNSAQFVTQHNSAEVFTIKTALST